MTPSPQPRSALRRADDGTVQLAAERQSSLAVDVFPVMEDRRKNKKDKTDETVELTVTLPRRTHKRLRRKAETHGWTVEEAASHVLQVWADD